MRTPQELRGALDAYVADVLEGRRVVGRLELLAVQRHARDLEHGAKRGLRFEPRLALRACWWIEARCRWSKGEWAGKPVVLEGWQLFVVGSLFGWQRQNEMGRWVRRYRDAYVSVARKNGKSELAAMIALLMLILCGEQGGEIYSAATKKDQAAIVWRAAASIVRKSPELRREIGVHDSRYNMAHGESESKFEAVGADADTLDGLGPILAVVDELHAHRDSSVYDVLESGMGARREPLRLAITTAGQKRHGVCWDTESDGAKILEGAYGDPAAGDDLFVFIARADEADDPFSEVAWQKANPNLGVSVHLDQLRVAARTAKRKPSALGEFERKRLNRWSESSNAWLTMPDWDACSEGFAPKRGARCWVGLDLSSTTDYTAAVAAFLLEDDCVGLFPAFWIPEETLFDRQRADRVPVAEWVKRGLVNATAGNVVDQDAVKAWLLNLRERFDVVEVPMDPHNSTKLQTELDGLGFTVVAHRQGWVSMNPAIQEAETLILKRKIRHGGNAPLRWMFSNVAIKTDSQGNRTFSKDRAGDRIDGIVAATMAIGRAMISTGSAYDERDVRVVG